MTYEQITRRLAELQREYDRAVGRRDSAKDVMKKELGVESIADGKEKLTELIDTFKTDDRKFKEALEKFEKKYGNVLDPG